MPPRQQWIVGLALPLTLAAAWAVLNLFARPAPLTPLVVPEPQFDAARAAADAARWRRAFPSRAVGSAEGAAFRADLIRSLTGLGLAVEVQPFTVTVASEARAGVNVIAQLAPAPGGAAPGLLLLAHYDTPQAGGRDNVAAVAALVEIARVFAQDRPALPLTLLFADSGEYGRAWGARAFAQALSAGGRPLAALSLEALDGQDWAHLRVDGAGYLSGYAPLWLRKFGLEAAALVGAEAAEAQGAEEAVARALPFDPAGHAWLLAAGVPAIRLRGLPPRPEAGAAGDANGGLPGLRVLGQAVEMWARGLAARSGQLPPPAAGEWRLDLGRSLPAWAAAVATFLPLLPLLLAAGLALWEERPDRRLLFPELVALGGAALPALNGLAAFFVIMRLGWLPAYELFPAAPGDPFLLQPADWAVLVSLGVVGLSVWDIWRVKGWGALAGRLKVPSQRVTLLLVFSVLALAVWAVNGFAAALLLAPAGWLWPWIRPSRFSAGRALNVMLALGGLLPAATAVAGLALTPGLGLAWWFLLTGAAYGLYPLPAVAAAAVGLALFVRFLSLGWRPEDKSSLSR